MNPGSSTRRVQILCNTKVDFTSGIVEVGAELPWDQVYATIEPLVEPSV